MIFPTISDPDSIEYVADWVELFIILNEDSLSKASLISYLCQEKGTDPESTFIDDDIHEEKDCFVFPNPNEGKMNLYVESKFTGSLKVVVYDLQGNFVNISNIEKTDFTQKIELDLKNLSNGKYHYVIFSGNNKIGFGKFSIIK